MQTSDNAWRITLIMMTLADYSQVQARMSLVRMWKKHQELIATLDIGWRYNH